ncbi:hypothetical protein [Chelativorans salis]|uniref:Uncharacterized protein n=1 Tax=Chelativorans salis TaxID=2978478 RepID=A0ABT2LHM8_9HYPH|nr:hypothetical protein [Chelativorans sp. EGI FJ00035]MCT7374076.1 hypothetical protein [Chelativorans sp. EGI FJ00035]
MRKFIIFTSTLAVLGFGLGGANAQSSTRYNAADDFGPSEQNDLPLRMEGYVNGSDAAFITSGTAKVTTGYPARASRDNADRVYRGYNASDDFSASY